MVNSNVTSFMFIAIGLLTMIGAALHWGIVSRPGKLVNRIVGDTVARFIYFVAGMFLFVVGVGRLIGENWFYRLSHY